MEVLSNSEVGQKLTGQSVAGPDGVLKCWDCGKTVDAIQHLITRGNELYITVYAIAHQINLSSWNIVKLYCSDCSCELSQVERRAMDQVVASVKLMQTPHSITIEEVKIVDRSKPDDAVTG